MTSSVSPIYDEPMEVAMDDLRIVDELRNARRVAVSLAASGSMTEALSAPADSPATRVYVVKLLDVHPESGKVAGRRLMSEMGLDGFTRVCDLDSSMKTRILRACGESS